MLTRWIVQAARLVGRDELADRIKHIEGLPRVALRLTLDRVSDAALEVIVACALPQFVGERDEQIFDKNNIGCVPPSVRDAESRERCRDTVSQYNRSPASSC